MISRPPRRAPLMERILHYSMPEPNSGCWLWTGLTVGGYGKIKIGRKIVFAHRESYKLFAGDIPAGLIIRHKCDTPCCVNPDHLVTGTQKDNCNDVYLRGRRSDWRLCDKDRDDIFCKLHASCTPFAAIALEYGISVAHAYRVYSDACLLRGVSRRPSRVRKIASDSARWARSEIENGRSRLSVATELGVSLGTIGNIMTGIWRPERETLEVCE